jgi:uncharacterized protein YerC
VAWNLQAVADYVRTGLKGRGGMLAFMSQVRDVYTFTHERANRLVRFVRIVHDYRSGTPVRDIEAKYGCSKHTVLRYARQAGLSPRPRRDADLHSAIVTLAKQGKSQAQIAKACGCSTALVSKVESANGIARYKRAGKKS